MSRQPGQASRSHTKDLGGGKVLMRQKRVLARFLAASLSFRFVILKVGTMTFPFMTSSVTQWPLIIGSLGSEACPGWWKQHMVAEPEAESPQYHPAPELVRTLSLHQSRLPTEKFYLFFFFLIIYLAASGLSCSTNIFTLSFGIFHCSTQTVGMEKLLS